MTDSPPPAPPAAVAEEVRPTGFPVLRGQRWGDGTSEILLLHAGGADLDAWGPLPALLAHALDAAVVALDLPGHGLSDDPWQPERLPALLAALANRPAGSAPVAVVAAGDTAAALLRGANRLAVAAVVLLSPALPESAAGWERSPSVPKLFLAGSLAGDELARCRLAANALGGWAVVVGVPGAAQGAELLIGEHLGTVVAHAAGFLRQALARRA